MSYLFVVHLQLHELSSAFLHFIKSDVFHVKLARLLEHVLDLPLPEELRHSEQKQLFDLLTTIFRVSFVQF